MTHTAPTFFTFHLTNAFEEAGAAAGTATAGGTTDMTNNIHVDLSVYDDPEILIDLSLDRLMEYPGRGGFGGRGVWRWWVGRQAQGARSRQWLLLLAHWWWLTPCMRACVRRQSLTHLPLPSPRRPMHHKTTPTSIPTTP